MSTNIILEKLFGLMLVVGVCWGHGRLYEPPSRASAWRFGFNTPKDYNDNEGFCGGFSHQYQTQEGKCGICGDPWDESPRAHEVGGLYATGVVVRHYQEGQILNVTVDITANHLGHFEIRLCPDPEVEASQECLDKHRLSLADGSGDIFNISSEIGIYHMQLQLPPGLTCNHCVLQWRYVAGNNWGICPDRTGALGCGPQEEFRACADISITSGTTSRSLQKPGLNQDLEDIQKSQESTTRTGKSPKSSSKILNCLGAGEWSSLKGASKWCTLNCNNFPYYCPRSHCLCY